MKCAHPSKDDVLPIQVRRLRDSDEELGAVCVGARIGHGQQALPGVLVQEVLVLQRARKGCTLRLPFLSEVSHANETGMEMEREYIVWMACRKATRSSSIKVLKGTETQMQLAVQLRCSSDFPSECTKRIGRVTTSYGKRLGQEIPLNSGMSWRL